MSSSTHFKNRRHTLIGWQRFKETERLRSPERVLSRPRKWVHHFSAARLAYRTQRTSALWEATFAREGASGVEFESVVSVGEVLLGLCLYLRVCRNPVKQFGAVVCVFGVSCLILLGILFERDAAGHRGSKLNVVYCTAAWIGGKILFCHLFCDLSNASGETSKSCGIHKCFNKLVVGHGCLWQRKNVQNKIIWSH